jgi:uncharacterized protein (TIGR03435 family)
MRVLRHKSRAGRHSHWWDIGVAGAVAASGLTVGLYGIRVGQPLLMAFSLIGVVNGTGQLAYWLRPPSHPMHWWFEHMNLMLGSTIAATTAFLVNNAGRLGLEDTSLTLWLGPTFVGVPATIVWIRHYRARFAPTAARHVSRPRTARDAVTATVLIASFGATAAAQQSSGPPSFDVASVKLTSNVQAPAPRILPNGTLEISTATLRDLIRIAYPSQQGQVEVIGGPDWVRSTRFEIIAKAPTGMTPTLPMLRALLAERFKLAVRSEHREGTTWTIVRNHSDGRLGSGLKPVSCAAFAQEPPISSAQGAGGDVDPLAACAPLRIGLGPRLFGQSSIAGLATILSNAPIINGPIVDRTELPGAYEIALRWRADNDPNVDGGPDLFTALKEQLGLRLDRSTGTIEVLVIDAVELLAVN